MNTRTSFAFKLCLKTSFLLSVFLLCQNFATANSRYVGNLEWVLGDVKQAQITNALRTPRQVDKLLDGFKTLGVNGIRITIFAEGTNPNEAMFDYLYTQAVARGFKIFANPAQSSGGQRLANNTLTGDLVSPRVVLGDRAIANVVNRVTEFAQRYRVDWINAFNEDGRPDGAFSTQQINEIYARLYGNVNGAELIGSGAWGLPASLDMLRNTNMGDYITVATSHNLGFNHNVWGDFIAAAGSLPVWDSETNDFQKFPNLSTRTDAAIEAGVNGLVLYNSWNGIDLNTGALSNGNKRWKDKFIQYYVIQNRNSGDNIKPHRDNQVNSLMVQVPAFWSGMFSQWELVPTENDWFRFKNRATGFYFRPQNNRDYANIVARSGFSGSGIHVQWKTTNARNGYVFLSNRGSRKKLRSRNYFDITDTNNANSIRVNQAPASWTGPAVQWQLIEAN